MRSSSHAGACDLPRRLLRYRRAAPLPGGHPNNRRPRLSARLRPVHEPTFLRHAQGRGTLLVVDQLEELVTLREAGSTCGPRVVTTPRIRASFLEWGAHPPSK